MKHSEKFSSTFSDDLAHKQNLFDGSLCDISKNYMLF